MIGVVEKIVNLKLKTECFVSNGNNNNGKIIGCGDIGDSSFITIYNVLLVDDLKDNMLSISQLCDKIHKVMMI